MVKFWGILMTSNKFKNRMLSTEIEDLKTFLFCLIIHAKKKKNVAAAF